MSVLPRYAAQRAIAMGMVGATPVKDLDLVRTIYLITPRQKRMAPVVAAFLEAARRYRSEVLDGAVDAV